MLLLIDKPKGMTSHDVVAIVRRTLKIKKVGHAGTLDPNATGLLVIGVGREDTKKLGEITKNTKKTYIAEVTLGEERDSDDIEGNITNKDSNLREIDVEKIKEALINSLGEIEQIPPVFSAIRINGKKAYQLARKGKSVVMKPRNVHIYKANLVSYNFPVINIEYEVSSGTYIRSLARDLGKTLGTYAYLSNLRRTKIGEFNIEDAQKLEELSEQR